MRRGITRALSPSGHRAEAGGIASASLICVGLLISLPCFSGETINPTTGKTLLTTNVVWQGFTNVIRVEPIRVLRSNALWITLTNAPPFQPGMWLTWPPIDLPKTNSIREHKELFLKPNQRFNFLEEQAPPSRLGDYWLPGEFHRIIGKPTPIPPLNPRQL